MSHPDSFDGVFAVSNTLHVYHMRPVSVHIRKILPYASNDQSSLAITNCRQRRNGIIHHSYQNGNG